MKKITQTVCALAACVLLIPGCAAAGEGNREAEQAQSPNVQTEAAAHDDGTETVPAGIETENELSLIHILTHDHFQGGNYTFAMAKV